MDIFHCDAAHNSNQCDVESVVDVAALCVQPTGNAAKIAHMAAQLLGRKK